MTHRQEGSHQRRRFDPDLAGKVVKVLRDLVLFVLGAIAFIHELLKSGPERPQILIMSAALLGLPLILRGDEKRQGAKTENAKQPEGGGDG